MRVHLWKVEKSSMESLHCLPSHTLHPRKMPLPLVRDLRIPLPPRMTPQLQLPLRRRNGPRRRKKRRVQRKRHPLPLPPPPQPSLPWESPAILLMIWSTMTHSQSYQVRLCSVCSIRGSASYGMTPL